MHKGQVKIIEALEKAKKEWDCFEALVRDAYLPEEPRKLAGVLRAIYYKGKDDPLCWSGVAQEAIRVVEEEIFKSSSLSDLQQRLRKLL